MIRQPVVQLDAVEVGEARVENVRGSISESLPVGLLGTSFFNHFTLQIDPAARMLTLVENANMRGGASEAQWSERFRALRERQARLESHLEDGPLTDESRTHAARGAPRRARGGARGARRRGEPRRRARWRGGSDAAASRCCSSAGLWLAPSVASAELYKCQGPDGKTLFTSDRSQCPGASAHEPSGNVQRSQPSAAAAAASALRARPARTRAMDDEAEAQAWRAKRRGAESALRETEAQLETLREVAGWCNRGHEVWAEDQDGLRRGVDCEDVDTQRGRELRREQKRLKAYLAEGLEEECRRAGCLPGWLR